MGISDIVVEPVKETASGAYKGAKAGVKVGGLMGALAGAASASPLAVVAGAATTLVGAFLFSHAIAAGVLMFAGIELAAAAAGGIAGGGGLGLAGASAGSAVGGVVGVFKGIKGFAKGIVETFTGKKGDDGAMKDLRTQAYISEAQAMQAEIAARKQQNAATQAATASPEQGQGGQAAQVVAARAAGAPVQTNTPTP